jgi:hypothetical protein
MRFVKDSTPDDEALTSRRGIVRLDEKEKSLPRSA